MPITLRLVLTGMVFLLFFTGKTAAQEVVWVKKVLGYSSQMSTQKYAADQVIGKPNVLPACEHSPCAWVPRKNKNPEGEWILVEFEKPIRAKQVAVAENFNPGSIFRITLFDTKDRPIEVFQSEQPEKLREKCRMFTHTFPLTDLPIKSARIELNTQDHPGWSHIDAIGISGSTEPIEAKINLASQLEFMDEPENLGPAINSQWNEIMPVISPDGKTLVFNRKDHPKNLGDRTNDDIWFSQKREDGTWKKALNAGPPLNNTGHNYVTSISPDGNVVLLGNIYGTNGAMRPGLSIAFRSGNGFGQPRKLEIKNFDNLSDFGEYHLAADGKSIVMTIERKDGYGGKDVYVSRLEKDGSWSTPRNLGPVVNTAGTEMSPFLAADGKTLYFSSNGFSGYGKNDMYMTRRLDDTWTNWTEPQNLGPQINSEHWDGYYSLPASGDFAYFSSESGSVGAADIFRIALPREIQPDPVMLVRGRVLEKRSGQPLKAKIYYEDLETGEEVGVAISNPVTGEYQIVLPVGTKYGFRAESGNLLAEDQFLDLSQVDGYGEKEINLVLSPLVKGARIVLQNLFFRAGKTQILPESEPELEYIFDFLRENPSVRIELGGHTDNTCSQAACLRLSEGRAKTVRDWLVNRGIQPSRLEYKGYGNSRPRSSTDQKLNRRVEMTILEM